MRQKRWVPQVLWRLFRHRALTLASAIAALLPPPPTTAECRYCKGSQCLLCSAGAAEVMSFLVRPDDPSDYCRLLNRCFVVVSDDAPPLLDFVPRSRWSPSQAQILLRTIEMIMYEQPKSSNVICNSYDKSNHSSPIMEVLSSPAWSLLLERVGDDVMIYLLKYTSIFLPLPHKEHHQVAGPPISNLCLKSLKQTSKSQYQHTSLVQFGSKKKRSFVGNVNSMLDIQKFSSSFSIDDPSSSISCVGSNDGTSLRTSSQLHQDKHSQMSLSEAGTPVIGTGINNTDGDPNEELHESTNQISAQFRKRSRPFSWQRRRKRRHLDFENTRVKTSFATILTDKDSLSRGLQSGVNSSSSPCLEICKEQEEYAVVNFNKEAEMPWHCSCFLVLQAPQSQAVAKGVYINRQSMFYDLECSSSVFPRNHILSSLKPNLSSAKFLVDNIFGLSEVNASGQSTPCFQRSGFCPIGSACQYLSLVKLLKSLILRTQCCQHLRLLDKHCVVPAFDRYATGKSSTIFEGNQSRKNAFEKSHAFNTANCEETSETIQPQFEGNKSYCLRSQVVSFIWAVIRSIVPTELLGTSFNWRMLRRNIDKFIRLRRFEKFSLKQCMHRLKTSNFPFLSTQHLSCFLSNQGLKYTTRQSVNMHTEFTRLNDARHVLKHKHLQSWIFWLFSCLVVPLMQANFYVTETEFGKQDVYYYRKPVWEKLTNRAITCLKDRSYHDLDAAAVRNIISKRPFGFSKLRLRPKENGMRMLANLKATSRLPAQESGLENQSRGMHRNGKCHPKKVKFNRFKSVNLALRDTHAVLKGLQLEEPEKLGSSVFDYNGVYRKLCPFLIGLKDRLKTRPGVFVVVCDVLKAFDSVDQDKLLWVMKEVILKDEYHLKQSDQLVCTKKSLWVHKNLLLMDQNISTTRVKSSSPSCSRHIVLVNEEWSRCMKKEELFLTLKEHVKYNVLQLDKKFYLQGVGIPQGSILSSLLCSIYYGHLERNVIFPFLEKTCEPTAEDIFRRHISHDASANESSDDKFDYSHKYILLRFIDDFLLISTSKKQAAGFFSRLRRGFRDYNCYMNDDKFCLNFDIGHKSGIPSNRVYVGADGISFLRWSGLLINCSSLEVQADYTKYLNNHLRSTLTVCWQGKPGRHLKQKLCLFMRPKCHPIFFDSNINSAAVVRLNIYQAFLLCAMKFHCYICDLSYLCKLRTGFYLSIIGRSLRYMYALIKKRNRSAYRGSDFQPILDVEEGEVQWLGLHAYIQVLKRKESRHKKLLSSLRFKLEHRTPGSVPSQLNYAVNASHSSLIWKIKY